MAVQEKTLTPTDVEQNYFDRLNSASSSVAPTNMEDVLKQANVLSGLVPQQRKSSIYDLASDLSAGLAAQAASGQPASIGYGLTAGFKMFNDSMSLKKQKADEIKQNIMMQAYNQVEKVRAQQVEFRKLAAEAGYDYMLEMQKQNGGLFPDGNMDGVSANYLIEAHARLRQGDDSMIYNEDGSQKEMYLYSKAHAERIKKQYQQTDKGVSVIEEEKMNIPFLQETLPPKNSFVQEGVTYTFTGKYNNNNPVYTDGTTEFERKPN